MAELLQKEFGAGTLGGEVLLGPCSVLPVGAGRAGKTQGLKCPVVHTGLSLASWRADSSPAKMGRRGINPYGEDYVTAGVDK